MLQLGAVLLQKYRVNIVLVLHIPDWFIKFQACVCVSEIQSLT